MPILDNYSYEQLESRFGAETLKRAINNLHRIESVSMVEDTVWATVSGQNGKAHRVQLKLIRKEGGLTDFKTQCTCQDVKPCEHGIALLLMNMAHSFNLPKGPSPLVKTWLEAFRAEASSSTRRRSRTRAKPGASAIREILYYNLIAPQQPTYATWIIQILKCGIGKNGPTERYTDWSISDRALLNPPKFVQAADFPILRILRNHSFRIDIIHSPLMTQGYKLEGDWGAEVIEHALATGRLMIAKASDQGTGRFLPLSPGETQDATMNWSRNGKGQIIPTVNAAGPGCDYLPLDPPWYLDRRHARIGVLRLPFDGHLFSRLMTIPPLKEADLPMVSSLLSEIAPEIPAPVESPVRVIDVDPTPILSLGTLTDIALAGWRSYRYGEKTFDYATLSFRYEDVEVVPESPDEFFSTPAGETVRINRRMSEEVACVRVLNQIGFLKVPPHALFQSRSPVTAQLTLFGLDREAIWPVFIREGVAQLQRAGWEVWIPSDFRHRYLEVEAWEASLDAMEDGWFGLDLGIIVEGRRLPLAPLIYELFSRDNRWAHHARIDSIPDDERIILITPDHERLLVPAERLKPLARMLIDLFDTPPTGALRFSAFDAPRLAELGNMERWQFKGMEAVTELANRLKSAQGVTAVEPPQGFALQLRTYQLEGLAWLQFLREQNLAGILADDMGLGKTAQALSHLLLEKESGRMDHPALVVMPTSLIYNWRREAEKFAPDLRVLSLQGGDRKQNFAAIPESDVILTTYPLLWRDEEALTAHEYHLLILDEAQTVKNAASQAAQVVRKLTARHRLCLTGTPLENHLGELWAQFDFLLPGFLRDSKSFTSTWRTPIEKHGDKLRRDLLARRVKPFILRRRKEDVAKELPEKTIIVRSVELEGGQRDLYEAVRIAMNEKVQQAIAEQGFARSHIVILDALLKLRQVCCDPRLLKLESARKVRERAKLDLLMDMLPELVDEGRRILVFSQFTSMLSLIETELQALGLGYTLLTGDTRDRETVINRFQEGEVPIFLISLKAGGVGLNLTTADTVIHYDPWWNPAVENQATDRAHRIGQTKQVFVYKLVVAGSIEEKILALQEKKAELAAGVLSEDSQALTKFGESDIRALLEPLPSR